MGINMIADPILNLFSLCTNLENCSLLSRQIVDAAGCVENWNGIPAMAEKHGMAPLLKLNLSRYGVTIPIHVRRDLGALGLRHQLINQVRMRMLSEIIPIFQTANIPIRVLKGAALAQILYPDISLRPMSDIDLLIRKEDTHKVWDVFHSCGYQNGYEKPEQKNMHHLPGFIRQMDGFTLIIEVHHHLLRDSTKHPQVTMENLCFPPMSFSISPDTQAYTLAPEDMLYHLCRHAFFDNHALEHFRMIWVADILNMAEKFIHKIDWNALQECYPLVTHTLTFLNEIRPLSEDLIAAANIKFQRKYSTQISPYQGWPGVSLVVAKQTGIMNWMHATIFPSTWWLRIRYKTGKVMPLWICWLQHIFILFTEGVRRVFLHIKRLITRCQTKRRIY